VNRLATETSPYLRQHADNPVDWYPWGPDAFAAAADRNVPILLSVGYSACHWCHVMAHECFDDVEVADVMNRLFVNVKVDREERPDVDSIYMDAVQAMTGRGGWPMTVFLRPDGRPFYGGTYFPKPSFLQLMTAIDDVWRNRPADVEHNVAALAEALDRSTRLSPIATLPDLDLVDSATAQLERSFDPEWGGFGTAPKFPSMMSIDLLLRNYRRTGSPAALRMATTTLDAMASGGMYDHLGGGFARYSVDRQWLVPHFEKMLYDQALLIRVYVHAAQLTGDQRWQQVVEESIEYVLRDLRHVDGGFYSAEDADSPDEHGHGHEGLFYTWLPDEVRAALGDDFDAHAVLAWFEIGDEPNFVEPGQPGRSIPSRLHHRGQLLRPPEIERARQRLFDVRALRRRPGLDDKVVTEWNGLMLSTLCEAAGACDREDWREAAVANGEFLLREVRGTDGRWFRSWHASGSPHVRHAALAADHAALIDGFTRLGELTGQARWIDEARLVADVLLDHFWDVDNGGLFTTADDAEALIVRQKDLLDDATPSANSTAAIALSRLAALTGEARYANHADRILQLLGRAIPSAPTAFCNALDALELRRHGIIEVVIPGRGRRDIVEAVQATWAPDAVLAWGEPYDSPLWTDRHAGLAYVCRQYACLAPSTSAEAVVAALAAIRQ
jgi:uncharacterized protein YyaL (SSP411 family)